MRHFSASDVVSHCLPMSNKKGCKAYMGKAAIQKNKIGFQDQLSLTRNAGQKYMYCRILLTCIRLLSVFKTFVLPIVEWRLKTGFTVCLK